MFHVERGGLASGIFVIYLMCYACFHTQFYRYPPPDNGSLHLEVMYAIGAVDVSSFDPACMARMCERAAEREIEEERIEAQYEKGADRHEFKLAFGG